MTELESLALKHGTDKASHGYCPHYEMLIGYLHHLPITLIEIGIGSGDSLRMWKEWMPKATIYGVDIDEKKEVTGFTKFQANQNDCTAVDQILEQTGRVHVLIDDAGHNLEDQKKCFNHVFPKIVTGGWYIIEDLNDIADIYNFNGSVEELHMLGCNGHGWILFLKKR